MEYFHGIFSQSYMEYFYRVINKKCKHNFNERNAVLLIHIYCLLLVNIITHQSSCVNNSNRLFENHMQSRNTL